MNEAAILNAEPLLARASRWRSALADAATGPLVIASEVMQLAADWESVREEAAGLDCTTWLRKQFGAGNSLAWFEVRARAVEKLGEACRRTIHHSVAVWVANNVPEGHVQAVKLMLMREAKANGGNPLTLRMAQPRVREITGRSEPKKKTCARCQELEKLLLENGVAPPE